jgi:hypothetical protein
MKSEDEPITDDEWLLRRVPAMRFRTEKTPIISPNAFEPRITGHDPDIDGISLYRAKCLTEPAEILATVAADRRHEFAIVRISVRLVKLLGLSVRSSPDHRVKGHVVIPELNSPNYKADKGRFTPMKESLAKEASKDENIVRRPSAPEAL